MNEDDDVNIEQCSTETLLPSLFRLQSQRCITYQRLADAQTMFFRTHQLVSLQNFLSDIAIIFARISEDILRIKTRFHDRPVIVKHIEQLQDYEQTKLQWTNDLFLARVQKQDEQIEPIEVKLSALLEQINDVLEELRYDQEEWN
jgi:hypothetical protein